MSYCLFNVWLIILVEYVVLRNGHYQNVRTKRVYYLLLVANLSVPSSTSFIPILENRNFPPS
jgi:hypothetical protein